MKKNPTLEEIKELIDEDGDLDLKKYTVQEIIDQTKGQYRSEIFKAFFEGR